MTVEPEDVIGIGDDLLERYPDAFSGEFEHNKRKVKRYTDLQSPYIRNRVAGYITRQCPPD